MTPQEYVFSPDERVVVQGEGTSGSGNSYHIVRKLGEGGFGVVYQANNEQGIPYALKILKLWALGRKEQDNYRKRFARAYRVMNTSNSHLIHSVDYGEAGGNPYYIMEFCPDGDLLDHFEKRSYSNHEQEVVRCMYQSAIGLRELHDMGMVHRDIKPENVMLRRDGSIALNDFDLAGDENNRYTTQYVMGIPKQSFYTRAFAPPEQVNPIRGKKEVMVMPTIDIFAYAVMVYQLLTGEFPFGKIKTDSDIAVYYAHANNDQWNRDALRRTRHPDFWEHLLLPCLKGDYQKRLSDVGWIVEQYEQHFPELCQQRQGGAPQPQRNTTGHYALEVVYGDAKGQVFSLPAERGLLTLGRDTSSVSNDIPVLDDENQYVSRRHATLEWDPSSRHWYLRDGQFNHEERQWKRSKNGTHVNSHEVDALQGTMLSVGDMVFVGEVRMKVIEI